MRTAAILRRTPHTRQIAHRLLVYLVSFVVVTHIRHPKPLGQWDSVDGRNTVSRFVIIRAKAHAR